MSGDLWRVFLDWIPFVVFCAVLLLLMRLVVTRPQQNAYRIFMSEQIAEIKRMNALLERIASTLEKQQPRQ